MMRSSFGTFRGLVRLALSYPQTAWGLAALSPAEPEAVRRLVFVCQGNICRSAFADAVAQAEGMESASFGLSTDTGRPAHGPAIVAARTLGYEMEGHSAVDRMDFEPCEGDLLLAMEVRQMHRLAADPRLGHLPRQLLGHWAQPRLPHLHDPYGLDDRYMATCLARIERAVKRLIRDYPGARLS
ncbi:phosphotyrosine protein phosphatase [Sphingobium amiense]|uniref:Phosphotyrosine protein phosphatase n=1 Tax=Sphingobium amiense TaxID=135719 RepID=A0A494W864_9SPHN|nr:phosphotyrosine protein phosphatase [Sphingobium amiense]BBD99358.1 phosphotyrosine protein phosphatase [Sphingobium amiense]